jgi:Brp/Blh family beta-carotene 15,15'-monooxygenase
MATERQRVDWLQPRRIEDWFVFLSRGSLLAVTAAAVLAAVAGVSLDVETQMLVYLVGMVVLNLPHGGFEHFENVRHRGVPFGIRYVAVYLAVLVAFVATFFVAPILALGLAFATAIAKGGHGDLHVLDAVVGSGHLESRVQRGLAAFVRGGAIMIVPLVAQPEVFYGFSSYMLSMFDPGLTGVLWERMELARRLFGGCYGVALVAHLLLGYLRGGASTTWLVEAGETVLLVAYFAVVPVVVAVGLYFPLWYSLRQGGRSAVARRQAATETHSTGFVLGVLAAGGLVTAAIAAAFWLAVPNPLGNADLLPGLVAFYTIFVCIVALPHVVVGEWLDSDRGIWYVP